LDPFVITAVPEGTARFAVFAVSVKMPGTALFNVKLLAPVSVCTVRGVVAEYIST
jgi:hypothetical protein